MHTVLSTRFDNQSLQPYRRFGLKNFWLVIVHETGEDFETFISFVLEKTETIRKSLVLDFHTVVPDSSFLLQFERLTTHIFFYSLDNCITYNPKGSRWDYIHDEYENPPIIVKEKNIKKRIIWI